MSKKDRLKAQKAKQDKLKKEIEEQEKREYEEGKASESKAAKKMRKQAKRVRPNNEPVIFLILKILAVIPFAYSGFFYGGVLAVGILGGYIDDAPPEWVAPCVIIGAVVIAAGIFISFFKKYIISFVLSLAGTAAFMKAAQHIIDDIRYKLDNNYVEAELQNMDVEYMQHYYPIMIIPVILFILLICSLIIRLRKRRKAQYERDTAPVKSIVED